MAYITLNEIKEILPEIMRDWIDKDDESWEWIFQEIEQKCHIGKRLKGKKWQKKIMNDIDKLYARSNVDNADIGMLAVQVKQLDAAVTALRGDHKSLHSTVCELRGDITAAKSMAEIAKNRTETDYSKYSGKSDGKVSYGKDCEKMCSTCKYSCNIDGSPRSFDTPPCDSCNYNNKWEAKDE